MRHGAPRGAEECGGVGLERAGVILVHMGDNVGFRRDEGLGAREVGEKIGRRKIDDAAEAADEVRALGPQGVETRNRGNPHSPRAASWRARKRARAVGPGSSRRGRSRVTRPPANGSPAAPVPSKRRLARGSAARFWVWRASLDINRIGVPSGSVATVTSEA